jgi:hypothetical protein
LFYITSLKVKFKFVVYTIVFFPLVGQAVRGWMRKMDGAWMFHVVACWVTLLIYGWGAVRNMVCAKEENRSEWGNE